MSKSGTRNNLGGLIYLSLSVTLGAYFTFAAVQGDYGVFRRVEILAEADTLRIERDRLTLELAKIQNLTLRLSDNYLDIDLLDQQARDILGYIRLNEIAIR